MKVLVTVENSYGKGSGDEVCDVFVTEDSKEKREELVEEFAWSPEDIWDDVDGFINGKQNSLDIDLVGGDWDEPTGRFISIRTKEEAIEIAQKEYNSEVTRIEYLFN